MRRVPILLVVVVALSGSLVRADDCPFAQYSYARETGQIQITTGFMERPMDLVTRIPAMDLRVVVDRDTLVSCPLSDPYVVLDRIAIDPVRRYIALVGHEYTFYCDGFETRHVIDEDWLNARAGSMRKLVCGDSKK